MKEIKPVDIARKYALDAMGNHEYRSIVEFIEKLKPIVPVYDYHNQSNFEEIKFKLAQLQMHQTVMSILKPEAQNE